MYKKVFLIEGHPYAVGVADLGTLPLEKCHKCLLEDCGEFEIIDGDSIKDPFDGSLICWWERKKLFAPPKN